LTASVSFSAGLRPAPKKSDGSLGNSKIFFNQSEGNIKYEMWNNKKMFDSGTINTNKKMR